MLSPFLCWRLGLIRKSKNFKLFLQYLHEIYYSSRLCIIKSLIFTLLRITESIDDALRLSSVYQVEKWDLGVAVVLFLVSAITSLLDCAFEDWGFLVASDGQLVNEGSQSMDVDGKSRLSNNRSNNPEHFRQTNACMALEVLENMCSSKYVQVSLRLVHLNMYV